MTLASLLSNYDPGEFYDEMFESPGVPRKHYEALFHTLSGISSEEYEHIQQTVNNAMLMQGITFTVYNDTQGTERIFPFDLVPRIIPSDEWDYLSRGLEQRIHTLNLFVHDIYNDRKILKDGVVPEELVLNATNYRPEMVGFVPPKQVYIHICGSDLVRDSNGQYYVLEDNGRSPSGVSYMIENRTLLKKVFAKLFAESNVASVRKYPTDLRAALDYVAPVNRGSEAPNTVVLTPGIYNSAYFEHSFLARAMGAHIVEGRDLIVRNDIVYMRTIHGLKRVDVIYRRVDDDYLDPTVFKPESILGAKGLISAYKAGNVSLANGVGVGVADDKLIYTYVPDMIKYYLGEDPILPNVPTYNGLDPKQLDHILNNADKLVMKPVNESGGYGICVGPHSTKEKIEATKAAIRKSPRNWIAQNPVSLSRHPTWLDSSLAGRHVDLRPYILYGEKVAITPGGLTRVALNKGSLVVNSSQGGGSKDTWVLQDPVSNPTHQTQEQSTK